MEMNVQYKFIDKLVEEKNQVTVFTINGYRMNGVITCQDQETIMIESGDMKQLVYKNAISTIAMRYCNECKDCS